MYREHFRTALVETSKDDGKIKEELRATYILYTAGINNIGSSIGSMEWWMDFLMETVADIKLTEDHFKMIPYQELGIRQTCGWIWNPKPYIAGARILQSIRTETQSMTLRSHI